MICGIGIDIVQIDRIERACQNELFVRRILTPGESYQSAEHMAGIWACKEAVFKALGTGLGPLSFQDVVVAKGQRGQPLVTLSAKGERCSAAREGKRLWVSISHEKNMAVAQAILEG